MGSFGVFLSVSVSYRIPSETSLSLSLSIQIEYFLNGFETPCQACPSVLTTHIYRVLLVSSEGYLVVGWGMNLRPEAKPTLVHV